MRLFRWMSWSYLGAYDMIWVPTEGSQNFLLQSFPETTFSSLHQFPVQCHIRCPPFMEHIQGRSPGLGWKLDVINLTLSVRIMKNAADSRMNLPELTTPATASRRNFNVDFLLLGLFLLIICISISVVNIPISELNISLFQFDHLRGALLMSKRWKVDLYKSVFNFFLVSWLVNLEKELYLKQLKWVR